MTTASLGSRLRSADYVATTRRGLQQASKCRMRLETYAGCFSITLRPEGSGDKRTFFPRAHLRIAAGRRSGHPLAEGSTAHGLTAKPLLRTQRSFIFQSVPSFMIRSPGVFFPL